MKVLTFATKCEGYFDLSIRIAQRLDYKVKVLGWGIFWTSLLFYWDNYFYFRE